MTVHVKFSKVCFGSVTDLGNSNFKLILRHQHIYKNTVWTFADLKYDFENVLVVKPTVQILKEQSLLDLKTLQSVVETLTDAG